MRELNNSMKESTKEVIVHITSLLVLATVFAAICTVFILFASAKSVPNKCVQDYYEVLPKNNPVET